MVGRVRMSSSPGRKVAKLLLVGAPALHLPESLQRGQCSSGENTPKNKKRTCTVDSVDPCTLLGETLFGRLLLLLLLLFMWLKNDRRRQLSGYCDLYPLSLHHVCVLSVKVVGPLKLVGCCNAS